MDTPHTHDIRDITVIGGGPTGLFAQFYAGMRGATSQIVDALPQLGGQLTALYPEKFIFDAAGFSQVLAKDLVKALADQASRWSFPVHLGHRVTGLEEEDGDDGKRHFVLVTETGDEVHRATHRFPTRSIVIAAGIGAFSPRRLPQPCAEGWYGRGIYDVVTNPDDYAGQKVMIIGGGDSAFDWAAQLAHKAESVTLVHRSDRFRAHGATVAEVQANAQASALATAAVSAGNGGGSGGGGHSGDRSGGRTQILTFHELHDILAEDGRICRVVLKDIKAKTTREVEADVVLPMLGFVSDIGPLADWGLTLEKDEIVVNSQMETGRPGVYAAGDITTYPGKLKLIATGFGEAATAVNQAVHWIYPEKKVAPGHSSNMAIFGQKDD